MSDTKEVLRVKLHGKGKADYFDPCGATFPINSTVIVELERCTDYGEVVSNIEVLRGEDLGGSLQKVLRQCTEGDLDRINRNQAKSKEALQFAQEKVDGYGLEMKMVDAEYTYDGSRITIFFIADGRVDFRMLVKDLAGKLRTRIQLEQIGVRDYAKKLGGYGVCGRTLCCSTFLQEFDQITVKMGKTQDLATNPNKLSGVCGRLMCCLRYEYDQYEELLKCFPKEGDMIETAKEKVKVLSINPISALMLVENKAGGQYIIQYKENPETENHK